MPVRPPSLERSWRIGHFARDILCAPLKNSGRKAVRGVVVRMGTLAQSILICGFCAATLLTCILLFLSLKRENARLRRRAQADHDAFQQSLNDFQLSLSKLQSALAEREAIPLPAQAAAPLMESMDINKRSQVLRLYRRGESPEQIAATLHLPRTEVELLLKVHRAVISQL